MSAEVRRGQATRRAWMIVLGAALWSLGAQPGRAQALPGANSADLTLPPALRVGVAPASPTRSDRHHRVGRTVTQAVPRSPPVSHHATAEPSHPVELGVTMRGGSTTPRVYGTTGTSEAIQESGSAFGAAMRFGF